MAPLAVKVAVDPTHKIVGVLTIVIVGFPTLIVTVCVFVQPIASSPVTVYVVVIVGLSTTLAVVAAVGFHV